jgi:hypothetical protein
MRVLARLGLATIVAQIFVIARKGGMECEEEERLQK